MCLQQIQEPLQQQGLVGLIPWPLIMNDLIHEELKPCGTIVERQRLYRLDANPNRGKLQRSAPKMGEPYLHMLPEGY